MKSYPTGFNAEGDLDKLVKKKDVVEMIQSHQGEVLKKKFKSPYPRYMDLVPFPSKYKQPNLQSYNGLGSPQEHVCHFRALIGGISDNDALLIRLFASTLKEGAFNWFSNLPENSVTSWDKLEGDFLNNFFDNVKEASITTLTDV